MKASHCLSWNSLLYERQSASSRRRQITHEGARVSPQGYKGRRLVRTGKGRRLCLCKLAQLNGGTSLKERVKRGENKPGKKKKKRDFKVLNESFCTISWRVHFYSLSFHFRDHLLCRFQIPSLVTSYFFTGKTANQSHPRGTRSQLQNSLLSLTQLPEQLFRPL